MAVDIFLKLDGVTGESRDSKHAKEIDILSWSWGAEQSGKAGLQGGAGAGKVNVHDITLQKFIDKSSPTLMLFCCNGKHISKGTLTMRKAGENPLEYLKIDLEEILISSYSTGGTNSNDLQIEHISLNFAKFNKTYTPQSKDGSAEGAVVAGWNIAENVKA